MSEGMTSDTTGHIDASSEFKAKLDAIFRGVIAIVVVGFMFGAWATSMQLKLNEVVVDIHDLQRRQEAMLTDQTEWHELLTVVNTNQQNVISNQGRMQAQLDRIEAQLHAMRPK